MNDPFSPNNFELFYKLLKNRLQGMKRIFFHQTNPSLGNMKWQKLP